MNKCLRLSRNVAALLPDWTLQLWIELTTHARKNMLHSGSHIKKKGTDKYNGVHIVMKYIYGYVCRSFLCWRKTSKQKPYFVEKY